MYCPKCGKPNDDNAFRCTSCGEIVQPIAAAPASMADDPVMRMLLPVGRSGWAVAAGYAGLFSPLLVPAPVALVLGVVALKHLRKHPKKLGRGRAIFGLIAGALGTAGLVLALLNY